MSLSAQEIKLCFSNNFIESLSVMLDKTKKKKNKTHFVPYKLNLFLGPLKCFTLAVELF